MNDVVDPIISDQRMDDAMLRELGKRFPAARAEHQGDQPDDLTTQQLEYRTEL